MHPHFFSAYRSRFHSIKLAFWQILLGVLNSHNSCRDWKIHRLYDPQSKHLHSLSNLLIRPRKQGARELCRVSLSSEFFLFFATGVTFSQDFSLDLLVERCDRHWVLLERDQAPCTNKNNSYLFHASIFMTFLHLHNNWLHHDHLETGFGINDRP